MKLVGFKCLFRSRHLPLHQSEFNMKGYIAITVLLSCSLALQVEGSTQKPPAVEGWTQTQKPPAVEGWTQTQKPPAVERWTQTQKPPAVEGWTQKPPAVEGSTQIPPAVEGSTQIAPVVEGSTQIPPAAPVLNHPCDTMVCEKNKTCVVRNVICEIPPCDPVGVCVLTTRKGTCPIAQPHNWWAQSNKCIDRCGVDGECIGERKCCTYGCTTLCRNPVELVKPGSCPNPATNNIDSSVPCNRLTSCNGDGECPWRMKCCEMTRCGMKCQMPDFPTAVMTRKDGRCPRKAMISLEQLAGTCGADKCSFDSQCPAKQRCCGQCPRTCTDPAPARREGRCPWSWMRLFLPPFFCTVPDTCSADAECNVGEKCCGRCPRRCRNALPARQSTCPSTSMFKPCRFRKSCDTDQACMTGQKCCKTRCGMKCMRCRRRFF